MDLIQESCVIHPSLHSELKQLPPLLSVDTLKHARKIGSRIFGRILEHEPEFEGVVWAKEWSNKKSKSLAGSLDEVEWAYRQKWASGGDHYLLMEILEHGLIPSRWPESWSADDPPTLDMAMKTAQKRGYKVPARFLQSGMVSQGEAELFLAAYTAIAGHFQGFRWTAAGQVLPKAWKASVSQLTGQFVIPDPLVDWKAPFVADQLWIINDGDRWARLIVIEVDGAHHLEPIRKGEDHERDLKFNALGYEVIRVNEAWCKVDPFRVVAEILRETGLCVDFIDAMVGGHLSSLDDYICAACGESMIRFEDDSIKEVYSGNDTQLVHKSCFDQIIEEKYETGESRFDLTP